ncbi:MAG: hypothetical protein HYZ17_00425 [Betaproteobacteria bacterium]|nr:hypothetical protein [Betaproteobacteria bacterium]
MPDTAIARVAALVDAGSIEFLPQQEQSVHLARWGMAARPGDGVLLGRAWVQGAPVSVIVQEGDFLGGAVGEVQAARIVAALEEARALADSGQLAGVLFLFDSGGVRLHEANAALVGLARVLKACCALRVAGVPLLSVLGAGTSAFGGAGVLAACGSAVFLHERAKLGVSGPKVLETLLGRNRFDAGDAPGVARLFGAAARIASGLAQALPDDAVQARDFLAQALRQRRRLRDALDATQADLVVRLTSARRAPARAEASWPLAGTATPCDALGWLWRIGAGEVYVLRAVAPAALAPETAFALGLALRDLVRQAPSGATLFVLEDSAGHEATLEAEALGLTHFLAWLALCHAEVRARGVSTIGLLTGCGISAAFFANALQAEALLALPEARVKLMEARAMERVTGLSRREIEALLENDPVFGQPARHLRTWKALAGELDRVDAQRLTELAAAMS